LASTCSPWPAPSRQRTWDGFSREHSDLAALRLFQKPRPRPSRRPFRPPQDEGALHPITLEPISHFSFMHHVGDRRHRAGARNSLAGMASLGSAGRGGDRSAGGRLA
jgi:hypothetical protein